jgi:hypothetical protein
MSGGRAAEVGDQHIRTEFRSLCGILFPVQSYLVTGPGREVPLEDVYGPSVARAYGTQGTIAAGLFALVLFWAGLGVGQLSVGQRAAFVLAGFVAAALAATIFRLTRDTGALDPEEARRFLALGAATGFNIDPELLGPDTIRGVQESLERRWETLARRIDWREHAGSSAAIARELVKRGRASSTDEVRLLIHALATYSLARKARSNDEREKAARRKSMARAWAELGSWAPASPAELMLASAMA